MKKVSPVTLRGELKLAKQVFRYLDLDTSDLERVKIKNMRETVTVEDLYTQEELDAIFGACLETRDRAMLQVLYESAVRASELLSMTFENIEFQEDDIATVIVKGKTGVRQVYVRDSLPSLRAWLNVHPTGKGEIWLNLRGPHNPLTYPGLFQMATKVIKRASLKRKKRKILHMFRHTRITELVRMGVRGQSLSKLVGWTKGSNMEAVYVHLSTADVENEVRTKVFGLEVDEARTTPLLKSTTCPRCDTSNDPQVRFCSKCNMPLSDDAIVNALQQQEQRKEEIEQMVQERVDESMERVVQAFTSAIQSIEDTKTLKDLAVVFAKKMREESASVDSE